MSSASQPRTILDQLSDLEREVLALLYQALDQQRKLSLSQTELCHLAVEHRAEAVIAATQALAHPDAAGKGWDAPLAVGVPNLLDLPIYRITPLGRQVAQLFQI